MASDKTPDTRLAIERLRWTGDFYVHDDRPTYAYHPGKMRRSSGTSSGRLRPASFSSDQVIFSDEMRLSSCAFFVVLVCKAFCVSEALLLLEQVLLELGCLIGLPLSDRLLNFCVLSEPAVHSLGNLHRRALSTLPILRNEVLDAQRSFGADHAHVFLEVGFDFG